MKIREIRAEGFGALRERTIALEGRATVLYGLNEAGKSTLLQLIRAILFGFAPRGQAAERFEPVKGGVHGGVLALETAEGKLVRVARRSQEAAGGRGRAPSAGNVQVTLPDGTVGGEEILRELLSGISSGQFRNLFAFTLTELQEMRTLTSEEMGVFLHSAGLGVKASAVTGAGRRLNQEMEARFKPKGRNQGIGRLLAEADALNAAWRRSLASAGRYNALAEEISRMAEQIAGGEERLARDRQRHAFLETAAALRERWVSRQGLLRELEQLPQRCGFPEDGLKRQEQLLYELEQASVRESRLKAKSRELENAISAYTPEDAAVLARRERFHGVLEAFRLYKAGFQQEQELTVELNGLRGQLEQKLAEAGFDPSAGISSIPAVTLEEREEASGWKNRCEEHVRRKSQLEAGLESASAALAAAEEKARKREGLLKQAVERLGALYPDYGEQLVKELPGIIGELRQRLRQAEETARELKRAKDRELEHRLSLEQLRKQGDSMRKQSSPQVPAPLLLAAMLICSLSVGAALFFGLRREWPELAVCLLLAAAGGGLALGAGGRRGRSSRAWPAAAEQAMEPASPAAERVRELELELNACRSGIKSRLEELALQLETAAGAEALTLELKRADRLDEGLTEQLEQWLAALLQERRSKEQQEKEWRDAAEEALLQSRQRERLVERLEQLDREEGELLAEWKQWLVRRQAPGSLLTPAFAPDFLLRVEQIKELALRAEAVRGRIRRIGEERQAYEAEAGAMLGITAGGAEEIGAALQAGRMALEEAAGRYGRMKEAGEALEEVLQELRQEADLIGRCRARLEALWQQAGAEDEEEFRRYGAQRRTRLALEQELASLQEQLAAGVGAQRLGELDELLERCSATELSEEIRHWEERLSALAFSLDEWKEEKGRLTAEYGKLLDGSGHGELREKQEELLARFGEEAAAWAVYAVAAGLLQKAKAAYEQERQPAVLRQASEHFARLTGGRYCRIIAPVGEERLLALSAQGEAVDSSRLSRGTAEQMYLALRFALAGELAKDKGLPLIMDDIFVNFDGERLARAAAELEGLSCKHQILLFTCHRHVLEAMQAAIPDIQTVYLSDVN